MHTVEFLPKAAVLKNPPLHLPSIYILTVTSCQAELLTASALLLSEVTAVQRPRRDGERVRMLPAWSFSCCLARCLPSMRQVLNKERAFPQGERKSGGSCGGCMLKPSARSWHVAERTRVRERDKAAFYKLNNDIFTIKRGALLPPRRESSGKSPLLILSPPVKLVSPSCCLVGDAGAHVGLGAAAGCRRRSQSWAPASF